MDSKLNWIVAALPIAVLLLLMIKCRWPAAKAAPVGLLVAAAGGLLAYRSGLLVLVVESAKGLWNAATIIIVVFPAILIYEAIHEAGAFKVIRLQLQKITSNELLRVLALSYVFCSFLQGITGFGVPVAIGAPLLLSIGVAPVWAVIVPLLGHAWANTFGTLAMAWDALVLQAGLSPAQTLQAAWWATGFLWLWNLASGILICWLYGKGRALRKGLPAVLLISLTQGGGQMLMAQVNTTLACFVPACAALVVVMLLGQSRWYGMAWRIKDSPIMLGEGGTPGNEALPPGMSVHQAFLPYYVLTAVTLCVLLIQPLKAFLGRLRFGFSFPEMRTGYGHIISAVESYSPFSPLTHASFFLLLSALVGFVFYRKRGWIQAGGVEAAVRRSVKKTIPPSIAVISFLMMSRMMSGTGQTAVLAQGITAVCGKYYVFFAPVVGMLGSFMTSSNMSSNILFGGFQMASAGLLGLDSAAILGAQAVGGAIGTTLAPGSIILGATTAGILGQEGAILKKLLPIALTAAISIGILLFILLAIQNNFF